MRRSVWVQDIAGDWQWLPWQREADAGPGVAANGSQARLLVHRLSRLQMIEVLDQVPGSPVHRWSELDDEDVRDLLMRAVEREDVVTRWQPRVPPLPQPATAHSRTVAGPAPVLSAFVNSLPETATSVTFRWDARLGERQYVNLPDEWGPDCGHEARLDGYVDPPRGGETVTFRVVPDPANPSKAKFKLLETSVVSDADGHVAARVQVPLLPGARFSVEAQTTDATAPTSSPHITLWRRLYYQLNQMGAAPDGTHMSLPSDLMSSVQGAFEAVFIEFTPSTRAAGHIPWEDLSDTGHLEGFNKRMMAAGEDDRMPFKTVISAIDKSHIWKEESFKTWSQGPEVQSGTFGRTESDPVEIELAACRDHRGTWHPLADVRVVEVGHKECRLVARLPFVAHEPVRVRFRFQVFRRAMGWGGTRGAVSLSVGYRNRSAPGAATDDALQQILTHELGHALGLLPSLASWRDKSNGMSWGLAHCGHKTRAGEPRCVMWYRVGGSGDRLRFCTHDPARSCAEFLLKADLSKVKWG